jgi:hypothetical protein
VWGGGGYKKIGIQRIAKMRRHLGESGCPKNLAGIFTYCVSTYLQKF